MEEIEMTESSDTDDELEEIPAFIRKLSIENEMEMCAKRSHKKPSRIDALLAEHRREGGKDEKLRALRDQLLTEIASSSRERYEEDTQDLASEHADHIEKLKVKSIELRAAHPGLAVFNSDNFGCLFSDSLRPVFTHSLGLVDEIWSSSSFYSLCAMVFHDTLIDRLVTSPNFNAIMRWLLYLMSIHSSMEEASNIEAIMVEILKKLQMKGKARVCWKPSAMDLLHVLVNLGADAQELTEFQAAFTQDEIRKHLDQENDENIIQLPNSKLNSERFRTVLTVLTVALQGRSMVAREDLSFMFYMLAKVALDTSLDGSLAKNFHLCFASLIDHYSDSDWPAVGSYLQMRLSYTFLYNQLSPETQQLDDSQLQDMQLTNVAELGIPVDEGQPSTLAVRLHNLVKEDRYKAVSVLRLLDMVVGDILYRASVQKEHLEYLLSQVTLVRKTIRDRVCDLDLSTVKDVMYNMTVKWSLALQNQRMNEGSIFPWATASTHHWVKTEILMDKKEHNWTDKMDDNMTDINEHV